MSRGGSLGLPTFSKPEANWGGRCLGGLPSRPEGSGNLTPDDEGGGRYCNELKMNLLVTLAKKAYHLINTGRTVSSCRQGPQQRELPERPLLSILLNSKLLTLHYRVAVISAKNHKRQRRKRQSVTAKRGKSQTPKVLNPILTLPNLT